MNKAVIVAFAVVIALLSAILIIVAFDYWNISTSPQPTPTPTPTSVPTPTPTPTVSPTTKPTATPINYDDMPGELTIVSVDYLGYYPPVCTWGGSPQLYVTFNWTGETFYPPKMRLSIEKYIQWWNGSKYIINQYGNRNPVILGSISLYDYAPTAIVELAFFTETGTTPFKAAYFPIADAGIVDMRPSPTPAPTPTPTPQPTPTPSPMQVDPEGQIIITLVTDYTGKYMPLAITFTWTGQQSYVPRIRVTANNDVYWHSEMTVNTGENGLSIYRGYPRSSYPSGTQVELAFFDATGETPYRTANYNMPS